MKLHGKIVAADSTAKTITIECDSSISGITVAGRVIVTDEWPEPKIFKDELNPDRFERVPGE